MDQEKNGLNNKFPCEKCGACCRAVNCQSLTSDNLCNIYDKRPFICNVDAIYNEVFKYNIPREAFYRISKRFCTILRAREE